VLSTLSYKKSLLRWWNQKRTHYTAFCFSSALLFSFAVLYLRTPNVREYEENMCKNINADEFLCWNVQKLTITIKKYKARIYEKTSLEISLEIALPKKRTVVTRARGWRQIISAKNKINAVSVFCTERARVLIFRVSSIIWINITQSWQICVFFTQFLIEYLSNEEYRSNDLFLYFES